MRRHVFLAGVLSLLAIESHAQRSAAADPVAARAGASDTRGRCPVAPRVAAPTDSQRRAARELAQLGQQAAILGDRPAALDQLRRAAALDPSDPDLAYQLARASEASGVVADATREYCRLVALAPNSPEAAEARERVAVLAPRPGSATRIVSFSPQRALSLGLIVPGAGQFYTGRPVRGALTFTAAGAAVACGMSRRAGLESVQETAVDPFGNPYTYTTTRQVTNRPCLVPGFAAAGAIAIASALEAFNYSSRTNEQGRLSLSVRPDRGALALHIAMR